MVVYGTEQVSPGCIKITSDAGLAFFIRTSYLKIVKPEEIVENSEFSDCDEEDILDAAFAFTAEAKAVEYLARAEQSRFGLTRKLSAKKIERKHIEMALNYLESVNYLSDERFARAWLNSRKIAHSEGRSKLNMELAARGIAKDVAESALNDFFSENSEEELCRSALKKCIRLRKTEEKIIRTLLAHGFQYGMIKRVMLGQTEDQ